MESFIGNLWTLTVALIQFNVQMTLSALAIAFPVSCVFALGRLSRLPFIYYPLTAYVNVLRSSPLLMIMFWAYYTGPMITGHSNAAYASALGALAAFEVAYFTEIIRAGLQSVSVGQRHASFATGLTPLQAMRFVVLPQALRRMLPSLLNQSIIAFQDSTIASVIGVSEVLHLATIINAREQNPIELYSMLAVLYLMVCYGLSRSVRALESRMLRRLGSISG